MAAITAFSVASKVETFSDCSPDSNDEPNLKPGSLRKMNCYSSSVSTAEDDNACSSIGSCSSDSGTEPEVAHHVDHAHQESLKAEFGSDCSAAPAGVASISKSGAWVPRFRAKPETEAEKMKRIVRSILNKLTLEKFEALYEQLATCGLSTPEHMSILMQEIFEKATSQHHFIEMYADLCVRLEADPRLVSARGAEGEATSFRHLLLSECQSAFLRLLEPQVPSADACEEQEALRRKMALGNVKLVGHLMVRGMLNPRLLIACSEALLCGHVTCPEALESAAALLTVTGKHFESRKDWQYADRLSAVFATIGSLTKDKKVPARSRFLLRDLLELREVGWPSQARPAVAKEKPMRLDEVREQAQLTQSVRTSAQHRSWVGAPPRSIRPSRAGPTRLSADAAPFAPKALTHDRDGQVSVQSSTTTAGHKTASDEKTEASTAERPLKSGTVAKATFDLKAFRKCLNVVLKDLSVHRNVAMAVRCIRAENVPVQHQAPEFADLLTRSAEETRGIVRRSTFAFIAGLVAGESPAFDRAQCLKGISIFFADIFEDLKEEVLSLERIVSSEMLSTLRTVLPANEFNSVLPREFAN